MRVLSVLLYAVATFACASTHPTTPACLPEDPTARGEAEMVLAAPHLSPARAMGGLIGVPVTDLRLVTQENVCAALRNELVEIGYDLVFWRPNYFTAGDRYIVILVPTQPYALGILVFDREMKQHTTFIH